MSAEAAVASVTYGSVVRLREGEEERRLVVRDERPTYDSVASDSLLGKALMGKTPGEQVKVDLGRGIPVRCVTILSVESR